MQIQGIPHVHGPHGVNAPHFAHRDQASQPTPAERSSDRVDISPAAEAAVQAAESGAIRFDVVSRIRAEIAAGIYETPDKLEAAVERMFDELA